MLDLLDVYRPYLQTSLEFKILILPDSPIYIHIYIYYLDKLDIAMFIAWLPMYLPNTFCRKNAIESMTVSSFIILAFITTHP